MEGNKESDTGTDSRLPRSSDAHNNNEGLHIVGSAETSAMSDVPSLVVGQTPGHSDTCKTLEVATQCDQPNDPDLFLGLQRLPRAVKFDLTGAAAAGPARSFFFRIPGPRRGPELAPPTVGPSTVPSWLFGLPLLSLFREALHRGEHFTVRCLRILKSFRISHHLFWANRLLLHLRLAFLS